MKWQNYTKGRRYITLVCYPLIPPRIHQMKKKKKFKQNREIFHICQSHHPKIFTHQRIFSTYDGVQQRMGRKKYLFFMDDNF